MIIRWRIIVTTYVVGYYRSKIIDEKEYLGKEYQRMEVTKNKNP
jgi:hypothetical protein